MNACNPRMHGIPWKSGASAPRKVSKISAGFSPASHSVPTVFQQAEHIRSTPHPDPSNYVPTGASPWGTGDGAGGSAIAQISRLFGFVSEPRGLVIIPLCAFHVAFIAARVSTVEVGYRKLGLEPEGLGVILQRAEENGFFDAFHTTDHLRRSAEIEPYQKSSESAATLLTPESLFNFEA